MNSYNKTEWKNGQAPALSAENLNKIEDGIEAITNEVIRSVQNVQLSGSASYPNVDSAIENDIVYRVFAQGNGSPCGWLRFCGSKNYVGGVGVAQIRMDMSGKIYIRKGAANGGTVTWPQTWDAFEPGGGASNAVLEITEETVPESVNWDDRIPITFSGNGYKLAFYCGELWALYSANEDPQTGDINYEWLKLVSEIEYDDIKSRISGKMSFAPLNPTAEQIAALPAGQLYSDTVNHKGVIKGGQSFYSTEYINGNYRKTVYHSYYRPPCVIQSPNAFNIGDTWITHDSRADGSDSRAVSSTDRGYRLLEIQESAYIQGDYIYIWRETTNNAFFCLSNSMISAEAVRAVDYGSPLGMCTEDGLLSVGDIVWTKDVNDNITRLFLVTKTQFEYNYNYNLYVKNIESIELSIPYNTYTKTEINAMIGDIETALSEV